MFDSHCHLTDLDDPVASLRNAQAAGVLSVLTCGYSLESNLALISLRTLCPGVPFAIGLHPWNADEDLGPITSLIREHRPDVIGEIGLDLWGDTPVHPPAKQVEVLEMQLQIARELSKPVTLHSRKAIDLLLSILKNHPGVRGALHAFSGSYEQLRPFLDLGFYVGIGGAVTRAKAKRVHRLTRAAPFDRILLETDAPAIGMDIVEPPDVRPAHLPRVAKAVAELRGIEVSEVEARTDDNAAELFGDRVALQIGESRRKAQTREV